MTGPVSAEIKRGKLIIKGMKEPPRKDYSPTQCSHRVIRKGPDWSDCPVRRPDNSRRRLRKNQRDTIRRP